MQLLKVLQEPLADDGRFSLARVLHVDWVARARAPQIQMMRRSYDVKNCKKLSQRESVPGMTTAMSVSERDWRTPDVCQGSNRPFEKMM